MADALTKYGLYVDDLSGIRALEPEAAINSEKLKTDSQGFFVKITDFMNNSNGFISPLNELVKEVEFEKMLAIGARNLLCSVVKQGDATRQKIQTLIIEKRMELRRLRIQNASLKKMEMIQLEAIEHLVIS